MIEHRLVRTGHDCYECTVDDVEEYIQLLYQAALCYADTVVAKIRNKEGYMECLQAFSDRYAGFLSNYRTFTNIKTVRWKTGIELSVSFVYRIGRVKLKMMELETDQEVEHICKMLFLPGMPPEAKILLVHNYLAKTVTYLKDWNNPLATSYTQSAYGALIEKKCVCQGYAEAFKRLMDAAGIECTLVVGRRIGATVDHAWNTVCLGQKENTYHVDVTWDKTNSEPKYTNFCKSDTFYESKRKWNKKLTPACPAKKDVLQAAQVYINEHKKELIEKGIDLSILGCRRR